MAKRDLGLWLLAAGALALSPAVVNAEPPPSGVPGEAEEPKAPAAEGMEQAPTTPEAKPAEKAEAKPAEQAEAKTTITAPIKLNESITLATDQGCAYNATVKGMITPAKATTKAPAKAPAKEGESAEKAQPETPEPAAVEEQLLKPNVTITAAVTCPNSAEIKVAETTMRGDAVPRSELESAIELRASVMQTGKAERCIFMPDFELTSTSLAPKSVASLCQVGGGEGGKAKGTK